MKRPAKTNNKLRLYNLLASIDDEDIKALLAQCFSLVGRYRSQDLSRFPMSELRDAIDVCALSKESKGGSHDL